MNAEIITIGDEILIGQIINTNASYIAEQLTNIGFTITRVTTVGDNKSDILKILHDANQQSSLVIITGGLGPTSDDITKPALCEYFNTTLRFDEDVFQHVSRFLNSRNVPMNELNRKQAEVPEKCKIVLNEIGTAPGLWLLKDKTIFIAMPGVPFEMQLMMENQILPELKKSHDLPVIAYKTILTHGIAESKLATQIANWEDSLPDNVKLAYLPSPGIVKLRITVSNLDKPHANQIINDQINKLSEIIPEYIYGFDNDTLEAVVGKMLIKNNKTVSLAESCTGGNLAKLFTSISGSSAYFNGSIVAYSNKVKIFNLGVDASLILEYGAVSKEVVESMAKGCLSVFTSDYAIAISGIAGPTGGTDEKPIGTVWIAIANKDSIFSQRFQFGENRERNIQKASLAALNILRKELLKLADN